tara:strand:- start:162 stop:410 length:249 start_codon:yes stop_codon:yes gene_type:complete
MPKEIKYFDDLSLEEMFKQHDHTYMMSDDYRYYKSGKREKDIIEDKVKSMGGWTQELVDLYNKYAPSGSFQYDYEWIKKFQK